MLGQGSANVYQAANKQSVDSNKNDGINTINQVQAFVTTKSNATSASTLFVAASFSSVVALLSLGNVALR
jgi:hypothetical protein